MTAFTENSHVAATAVRIRLTVLGRNASGKRRPSVVVPESQSRSIASLLEPLKVNLT